MERFSKPLPLESVPAEMESTTLCFKRRIDPAGTTPCSRTLPGLFTISRKASTSARDGTEAWAPMRVTESAAAAFANRSESGSARPSVNATASAALNVSPAAVVSRTSTSNAGA